MVNTYACTKATNSSRAFMNSSMIALKMFNEVPSVGPNVHPKNMTHVKARIIAWPAIMFAKSRIISAKGFVKTPNNSIAGIMGIAFKKRGTSGQKISFQYSLLPNRLIARKVHNARKKVILMLENYMQKLLMEWYFFFRILLFLLKK